MSLSGTNLGYEMKHFRWSRFNWDTIAAHSGACSLNQLTFVSCSPCLASPRSILPTASTWVVPLLPSAELLSLPRPAVFWGKGDGAGWKIGACTTQFDSMQELYIWTMWASVELWILTLPCNSQAYREIGVPTYSWVFVSVSPGRLLSRRQRGMCWVLWLPYREADLSSPVSSAHATPGEDKVPTTPLTEGTTPNRRQFEWLLSGPRYPPECSSVNEGRAA